MGDRRSCELDTRGVTFLREPRPVVAMAAVACTSCASPATCLVQKSLGTSSSHRAAARPVAGKFICDLKLDSVLGSMGWVVTGCGVPVLNLGCAWEWERGDRFRR